MYKVLYSKQLPFKLFFTTMEQTLPSIVNDLKIFQIIEGEYEFYIGDKLINLHKDEFAIIKSHEIHHFKRVSSKGSLYSCFMNLDKISEICSLEVKKENDYKSTSIYMKEFIDCVIREEDDLTILSKLCILLKKVISQIDLNATKKVEIDIITKVLEFMFENHKEKINIIDIANYVDCSEKHIMTLFKKATGFTIYKYLTIIRLYSSLTDLKENKKKILKIALDSGFVDLKSYYKCFNDYFKMTPKEFYKKMYEN